MKSKLYLLLVFSILLASCTKDDTPELLSGYWTSGEVTALSSFIQATNIYDIHITYLSKSGHYDAEMKTKVMASFGGTSASTTMPTVIFQFHLDDKTLVFDSEVAEASIFNGAKIITLDEKNLALRLADEQSTVVRFRKE